MSNDSNQQDNNNSPLRRFGNSRFSNNNQNNPRNSRFGGNNNQNNQANNPFGGNNNQNSQGNQPNNNTQPLPQGPPPLPNNIIKTTLTPVHRTVVRFELPGLGDPFFKLLNHPLNTDFGTLETLINHLDTGGESVNELEAHLNSLWMSYAFVGAALVSFWNKDVWTEIMRPNNMPIDNGNNDAPSTYQSIKALDIGLTLNVLGRARRQLLLADAPIIMSKQYLNRTLVSDDPRLVQLAKATSYIEEGTE